MTLFRVDTTRCRRDGICAAECPVGIISTAREDPVPFPTDRAEELCLDCGHCVAVCPTAALSHRSTPPEQCPDVDHDLFPGSEQIQHLMRARRSIRCYEDKPIPLRKISKLIDTARFAPTGHNSQCVQWLVIYKTDRVRKLTGMVIDWMRSISEKQPGLAETMQTERFINAWESEEDYICRKAPHVIVTHAPTNDATGQTACTIALTYLELAAPTFGLGTCWAGYFQTAANFWQPMKEELGLPKNNKCHGAMLTGYPRFKFQRIPVRKDPDITWS